MEITEVRIFPVHEDKLKAYVTITIDQCFVAAGTLDRDHRDHATGLPHLVQVRTLEGAAMRRRAFEDGIELTALAGIDTEHWLAAQDARAIDPGFRPADDGEVLGIL